MAAKQTPAGETPVRKEADYIAAVGQRPYLVRITDPGNLAFDTAAVLIAQGYRFLPDATPRIFEHNGVADIWLTLGQSDQSAIDRAKGVMDQALAIQAAEFEKAVDQAAEIKLEDYKRKEAEKVLDAKRKALAAEFAKAEAQHQADLAEIQRQAGK